jgi:hypothetical protein
VRGLIYLLSLIFFSRANAPIRFQFFGINGDLSGMNGAEMPLA